ncbi:CBO0543 family protein [Paenibacillus sp. BIC5C1]|uniref:CBO0543 family protein n=1 Tax=Paenibacillus TaxID=44249 RepID=UPI0028EF6806|nr:CBO0543 family protein [Paenibacillus sp. BIC5C1]
MLGNVIFGLLIPILIGGWILRRNVNILLAYYPLGVATSSCINSAGFNFFWNILPNTRNQSYAALPFDLGIYPIAGCLMMYMILIKNARSWPAILITSLTLTLIEWLAKEMGRVIYFNDWNIYLTFFSYLLPLVVVYGYSKVFTLMYDVSEKNRK